jgi:hypothetical protein
MRVRVLKFPRELLAEMLRKESSLNASLPSDAALVELGLDLKSNDVLAVFRTESIDGGDAESAAETDSPCKSLSKIGECKILQSLENRFAPQHRKLLTFEIESGILYARPIQKLANEWNEINDFVGKIGGRWIKDMTDGYWEIPLL